MSQAKLRLTIFWLWIGGFLAIVFVLLIGPLLRADGSIGPEQGLQALPKTTILLPGLVAFATFWFPMEERRKARSASIDSERATGALALTSVYVLLVIVLFIYPMFLPYDQLELGYTESFEGRLDSSIAYVALLSTLASAPIGYLTRLTDASDDGHASARAQDAASPVASGPDPSVDQPGPSDQSSGRSGESPAA